MENPSPAAALEPENTTPNFHHRAAEWVAEPYRSTAAPALYVCTAEIYRRAWAYRVAKRAFDLALGALLVPLLLPVMVSIAAVLKLKCGGPVFYRQRRVGQHGQLFYLYKFRTMRPNSDAMLADLLATAPEARREWEQHYKLQLDPRVTKLGAVLRRLSLDELPQLFNVLAGQMSFVGPRPVVIDELPRYGQHLHFYRAAKPGLTGLWQVSGRGSLCYDARVALDVRYVRQWSLLLDLLILAKTAPALWRRQGAY